MAHVDRMGRCLRLGGLEIGVGPFPHPPFSTPFEVLPLDLRKFVRRGAEHYVPVRYVGEVYSDERLGADTRHGRLRHTTPDVPPCAAKRSYPITSLISFAKRSAVCLPPMPRSRGRSENPYPGTEGTISRRSPRDLRRSVRDR